MRLKMGRITVKNLITYSYHGCYSEENEIGSKYKIDIWVEGDFESAEKNDSLENTVDYVALTDITAKEMSIPSKLIEHVAKRIIDKILLQWPELKLAGLIVKKISPPMNQNVHSVEYTIEKTR